MDSVMIEFSVKEFTQQIIEVLYVNVQILKVCIRKYFCYNLRICCSLACGPLVSLRHFYVAQSFLIKGTFMTPYHGCKIIYYILQLAV